MEKTCLFKKESISDHFTWSNKHPNGIIYYRIDWVITDFSYLIKNDNTCLYVKEPGVSDHAFFCLLDQSQNTTTKSHFKILNVVINVEGFMETVTINWKQPLVGSLIYILWKKLQRLQNDIKEISKPLKGINDQIIQAMKALKDA